MTADVAVVLPTCRGYSIPKQDMPVDWITVHDQQEWEIKHDDDRGRRRVDEGCFQGIRGTEACRLIAPPVFLYGARTSAIRQAGLDVAYQKGYPFVLTVDDDCVLPMDWARKHCEALTGSVPVCNNTVPGKVIRGLPLGYDKPVGISHGLWSGVLDYPAWHQLDTNPGPVELEDNGWAKIDFPFPMCGMNVGFRREALPSVYFQHQFLRHDDIFAGWIAQRVLQLHGYGFMNGSAIVHHDRASNAEANLIKEIPGDHVNLALIEHVMKFDVPQKSIKRTFQSLIHSILKKQFVVDPELNDRIHSMAADALRWSLREENA